jgi:hypothetical protein
LSLSGQHVTRLTFLQPTATVCDNVDTEIPDTHRLSLETTRGGHTIFGTPRIHTWGIVYRWYNNGVNSASTTGAIVPTSADEPRRGRHTAIGHRLTLGGRIPIHLTPLEKIGSANRS